MFIFPRFIIQSIGIFMGYIFNFFILGGGIALSIQALKEGEIEGFLGYLAFSIVMGVWTGYLVYSGVKRAKEENEKQLTK